MPDRLPCLFEVVENEAGLSCLLLRTETPEQCGNCGRAMRSDDDSRPLPVDVGLNQLLQDVSPLISQLRQINDYSSRVPGGHRHHGHSHHEPQVRLSGGTIPIISGESRDQSMEEGIPPACFQLEFVSET